MAQGHTYRSAKEKYEQIRNLRKLVKDTVVDNIWSDDDLEAFLMDALLLVDVDPASKQRLHLAAALAFTELAYDAKKADKWMPPTIKYTVYDFEELARYQKLLGGISNG